MFTPETYEKKFGINFSTLTRTNPYEQKSAEALGCPFLYEASTSRLVLTSLPDPSLEGDPRYSMSAELNKEGILTPILITWSEGHGYYPIFYAKGFIDIALNYFSGSIRKVKLDYINSRYIHAMYDQFFTLLGVNKHDPEIAFRQTTLAKRIIKNGYTNVSAATSNDYHSPLDGDELTFWLSK
jgi:hypothetical protein